MTVGIHIFPDIENAIGVTCGISQVDHVLKAIFAGFHVAGRGAWNRATPVRDIENITVLRSKFDLIPTGANIPSQPASKIIHIYFDKIQHATYAAVRSGALVFTEFSLSCFVHIDGIPVVPCVGARNHAGRTGVWD